MNYTPSYTASLLALFVPGLIFVFINPYLSILWPIMYMMVHSFIDRHFKYTLPCNELTKNILIKLIKIKCWVDGSIPVVLKDYKNRLYISCARTVPTSSSLTGYIVFQYKIGPIILEENGNVLDVVESRDSFVEHWLPLDREKRIEMILKYDCGFDF